jgi:diguanylate cyclase (GGDEF)-like protein
VAARWGGEEIMIMLLGANEDDARSKAENIRKSVEDQSFEIVPGLKVTISVGVAMYTKGINLDQLVKNSDLALYKAKEKGRNNVVAFSEI